MLCFSLSRYLNSLSYSVFSNYTLFILTMYLFLQLKLFAVLLAAAYLVPSRKSRVQNMRMLLVMYDLMPDRNKRGGIYNSDNSQDLSIVS